MKPEFWRRFFPTIRSRLLAVLAGCVLLPLIAGQLWMHLVTRQSLEESEIGKYHSLATEAARQVSAQMQFSERNLRTLSSNYLLRSLGTEKAWVDAIGQIAQAGNFWTDISLYSHGGLLLASTSDDYADPQERTEWFTRARQGETVISTPQMVLARSGLDVAVYLPLEGSKTLKKVIVRGRVPFDEVGHSLSEVNLGDDGYLVLLDGRGNALHHPDRSRLLRRYDGPGVKALSSDAGYGTDRDEFGREVYWIAHRLSPESTRVEETWTLMAVIPRQQIMALASQSSVIHLGAGLATLLLVASLGIGFSSRITRPIVHAAEAAHQLALGETHTLLTSDRGPREIRQLATAFNAMVSEVIHHRTDLQKLVDVRTHSLLEQQERSNHLSAQLRAAFEATEEAILILRRDGVVLGANRRFGLFFGARVDSLAGSSFSQWQQDFFGCFADPGSIAERWARAAPQRTRSQPEAKWQVLRPERRVLDVYASPLTADNGEIIGRLWVFRDLTHEQQLQESLEQAQKMEAIGRLAGGIAHDFNNLLTGILGNLALADGHLSQPGSGDARHHIHYAHSAAERAAQLVKGLLGFSRRSHLELTHCDINAALREFLPLVERSLGAQFPLELQLQEGLWSIQADISKLEQVIMNLCVNARDAMEAGSGKGRITIRTHNQTIAAQTARRFQAAAGDHVCLSVTDTGCGITPEIIDKIFEPFFTTKEQGKGTGLGLATSYGIVQQHGGWMECETSPGRGTTFHVFLPRNDQAAPKKETPALQLPSLDVRGEETVLLVDDEPMVRMIAETVLKNHGYHILTASDGQEAVDLFREHQDTISLILMDMTMPRMSGLEAFHAIREMDRLTPVIICSGYVVDLGQWQTPLGDRPNGFVQKPYNLRDLATTVRHLIDSSARRPPDSRLRPGPPPPPSHTRETPTPQPGGGGPPYTSLLSRG